MPRRDGADWREGILDVIPGYTLLFLQQIFDDEIATYNLEE